MSHPYTQMLWLHLYCMIKTSPETQSGTAGIISCRLFHHHLCLPIHVEDRCACYPQIWVLRSNISNVALYYIEIALFPSDLTWFQQWKYICNCFPGCWWQLPQGVTPSWDSAINLHFNESGFFLAAYLFRSLSVTTSHLFSSLLANDTLAFFFLLLQCLWYKKVELTDIVFSTLK